MADKPGMLGWFISNPIAANLLMVVLVGGLYNIPGLDKQFFPRRSSTGSAFPCHPRASPREVEEQICVRTEEAIQTAMELRKFARRHLRVRARL